MLKVLTFVISVSISSGATSVMMTNQICHQETLSVNIKGDHQGVGLTLSAICDSSCVPEDPPVVSFIQPCRAADQWELRITSNYNDLYSHADQWELRIMSNYNGFYVITNKFMIKDARWSRLNIRISEFCITCKSITSCKW